MFLLHSLAKVRLPFHCFSGSAHRYHDTNLLGGKYLTDSANRRYQIAVARDQYCGVIRILNRKPEQVYCDVNIGLLFLKRLIALMAQATLAIPPFELPIHDMYAARLERPDVCPMSRQLFLIPGNERCKVMDTNGDISRQQEPSRKLVQIKPLESAPNRILVNRMV